MLVALQFHICIIFGNNYRSKYSLYFYKIWNPSKSISQEPHFWTRSNTDYRKKLESSNDTENTLLSELNSDALTCELGP